MAEKSGQSFLVVRLGSLGDLVHTVPAVAALRSSFPEAKIDWVIDHKWASFLELVTGIDAVIPLERRLAGHFACIRRLKRARYECSLDFQGLYKSAALAWLSGAPRRVGFGRGAAREPGAAWFYTDRVLPASRHIAERNISLAVRAGAKQPGEMRFALRVPESAALRMREKLSRYGVTDYVVVSPGGGWKAKCWPPERYGSFCSELWRRHGLRAVVNIGPEEAVLGLEIVRNSGSAKPAVVNIPVPELAALVAEARLVIAADTGPLHLAAALGTHVVALFGPTNAARNGPLPRGVVLRNGGPAETSYERGNYERGNEYSPAMLSITVEQVLAAAEQEMSVRA
jgi:lipopolysaccharide heptosyltransferase I